MAKDVILDRYARLYEIPHHLALLGHDVRGYCLSYRNERAEGLFEVDVSGGSLRWASWRASRFGFPELWRHPRRLTSELEAFEPDIVIAGSDIPHVALGALLSRRLKRPFVADLYDNFESFGQARLPGMVWALRAAVRSAALVTTTSDALRDLIIERYRHSGPVVSMPSTIDVSIFHPRDRSTSRQELGLSPDVPLIGTAGALHPDKGIPLLLEAWERIRDIRPDVRLVLAGPRSPSLPLPSDNRIDYVGLLDHASVAKLFCALDVGVICVPDTPFGRHSFPQKAYEMLACDLPAVASRVGAMQSLFESAPECLHHPGDAADMATRILQQLERRIAPDIAIPDWKATVSRLEQSLITLVRRPPTDPHHSA